MSVCITELLRREREHLCVWCGMPAQYIINLERHGVHCKKHARRICANYKRWKARQVQAGQARKNSAK